MIRTLLVDDQQLVRAGVRMLCESTDDIEVVGEAPNGAEAVRLTQTLGPEVVLMDLRMPGMDGTTATRRILQTQPSVRIVALTTFDDDEHLYPVLNAGACGFLAKDATPAELVDAIRQAVTGGSPFSNDVLQRLVTQAVAAHRNDSRARPDLPLTPREREVLRHVGAGRSNADIAKLMHVGVTTVKTHIANLMDKTDSPNRVHLAIFAVRHNLTPG
jgi:DNA-binding NarL/FixJ family response regulator